MPKLERYILYAVIVAAFVYFAFLKKGNDVQPQDKVTVVVKYDSIPQQATNIIRPAVTVAPGNVPDNIIQILSDTAFINKFGEKIDPLIIVMQKYFEVRTQEVLSYTSDSLHLVNTEDTITENGIIARKTMVQCFKPITTITVTEQAPLRNKVFIGANLEAGMTGFKNVGPELSLLTKRDMLYQVGWNGYEAFKGDPYSFNLSAAWKIHFGKRK